MSESMIGVVVVAAVVGSIWIIRATYFFLTSPYRSDEYYFEAARHLAYVTYGAYAVMAGVGMHHNRSASKDDKFGTLIVGVLLFLLLAMIVGSERRQWWKLSVYRDLKKGGEALGSHTAVRSEFELGPIWAGVLLVGVSIVALGFNEAGGLFKGAQFVLTPVALLLSDKIAKIPWHARMTTLGVILIIAGMAPGVIY